MNLNQMNKHMVRKLNNHEAFPLHYPHIAPPYVWAAELNSIQSQG